MKVQTLLCASLLTACAGAPTQDARGIPPYGEDKPLPEIVIVQRTLANGLTVWLLPRDGLPRVDAVLAVRGGLASDPPEQRAALSEALAALIDDGTRRRDSRAIAEELQAMGGGLDAAAANDGITVTAHALASHGATLVELLADVARNSTFPAAEVTLARDNAIQELQANESDPAFLADRAWAATVYGAHPYARGTPTAAAIRAITPGVLRAEHARRFRPDRALLVLCGKFGTEQGFAWAEGAFGSWRGEGPAPADTPGFAAAPAGARVIVARPGSVQSSLRLGRPGVAATSPDLVPLQVANTILGGSFGSRLNQNLREDKGYTYGAYSRVRANRAGGAMLGGADVRNEVTGAAIGEFLNEYERLGSDGVTAQQLDSGKRYMAGLFLYRNQTQAAFAGTLAGSWLQGQPPEFITRYVQNVQAVSGGQVRAMAQRYFAPKDQSLIVIGDPAALGAQLAPFGTFAPLP